MFTNQAKRIIKQTPLFRWYFDQKTYLRRAQRRIPFVEQFLPKNGIGAELGVFKGHFSPILLEHTQKVAPREVPVTAINPQTDHMVQD